MQKWWVLCLFRLLVFSKLKQCPIVFLILAGSVDGVDVSENVVLISGEQTIAAMTTFKKGFRVLGNLSVSGLVDTVNLEEFDNTRFSLTREQEVEGSWTFEKDIYIGRVNK